MGQGVARRKRPRGEGGRPETVKEGREPEEATRSGLMARIKHPADVFSGACTRGIASDFGWPSTVRRWREDHRCPPSGTPAGRGRKIFPKDVNTNEAKSSPLGGWAEAPHGARWRRRRPYGGWRWRRDATQGRLTLLGPRTDRGGSRAGAPRSPGSIWNGVLRVGGVAVRCTFLGQEEDERRR